MRLTCKRNKFGTFVLDDLKLSGYDRLSPSAATQRILRPAKKGSMLPGGCTLWVSTWSKSFSSVLLGRQDVLIAFKQMRQTHPYNTEVHLKIKKNQTWQALSTCCSFCKTEFGWRSVLCYQEGYRNPLRQHPPQGFTLKPDDAGEGNYSPS